MTRYERGFRPAGQRESAWETLLYSQTRYPTWTWPGSIAYLSANGSFICGTTRLCERQPLALVLVQTDPEARCLLQLGGACEHISCYKSEQIVFGDARKDR